MYEAVATSTRIIPGFMPGAHRAASADDRGWWERSNAYVGTCGAMDPGDKPRDDNGMVPRQAAP